MTTDNVMKRKMVFTTDLPEGLYANYGPLGPFIHEYQAVKWSAVVAEVLRRSPERGMLAVSDGLNISRTFFWTMCVVQLFDLPDDMGKILEIPSFLPFWEKFRTIFNPKLDSLEEMPKSTLHPWLASNLLLSKASQIFAVDSRLNEMRDMLEANAGYSILCEEGMNCLLTRFPKLLEVGAGTGYFAEEFSSRGGDVIAGDNGSYHYSLLAQERVAGLRDRGIWYDGDATKIVREHGKGRALYMAWAEPRSRYPVLALREFEKVGGEHFIFQPGGYFFPFKSSLSGGSFGYKADDARSNRAHCREFLQELMNGWREMKNITLPMYGHYSQDALWVFERRRKK